MGEYLLDTNHLSPLVTKGHPLGTTILQKLDEGHSFSICVPVLTEFLFGIRMLPRAFQNLSEWRILRPLFVCYIPNIVDGELAADLQISLRNRGRQLETIDALIASVALRYELILLTTDKDFRPVSELQIENWLS